MPIVCTKQPQLLYYGTNALVDLDVPPRKLLHHPGLTIYLPDDDQDGEPKQELDEEQEGEGEEEEEVDTYSYDEFRMYEFKVRRCTRGRSHDWTNCPFAHPGEEARRRDPRRYHYSGTICPDFRRSGVCPRGDACEFAHGVFECWLHPAHYRTMPCKDGRRCRRRVCFFAHSPRQLRLLPSLASADATTPIPSPGSPPSLHAVPFGPPPRRRIRRSDQVFLHLYLHRFPHLVDRCSPSRCTPSGNNNNKNSITSSSIHKGCGVLFSSGVMGYDSLYEELTSSQEAMEISRAAASTSSVINENSGRSSSSFPASRSSDLMEKDLVDEQSNGSCSSCGPNLEWVNELLM